MYRTFRNKYSTFEKDFRVNWSVTIMKGFLKLNPSAYFYENYNW